MAKKNTPVVLADANNTLEDKYLLTVEYLVKRHIGNKLTIIQALNLDLKSKEMQYINDVTEFVNSIIESELFLFNLTKDQIVKLWKDIRSRKNNNVLNFVLYITSKLRFQLGGEYDTVVKRLAESFTYTSHPNVNSELFNVLEYYDNEFKMKQFNADDLFALFYCNPWLVTLVLISFIDPVL